MHTTKLQQHLQNNLYCATNPVLMNTDIEVLRLQEKYKNHALFPLVKYYDFTQK